jgi:hypothetical protein
MATSESDSLATRLLEGDKMAVLCREFGISRKTDDKRRRLKSRRQHDTSGVQVTHDPV